MSPLRGSIQVLEGISPSPQGCREAVGYKGCDGLAGELQVR